MDLKIFSAKNGDSDPKCCHFHAKIIVTFIFKKIIIFFGEKLISHFPNQKRIRKTFDQFSTGQLRPELPGKFS
jgi:hypothetical protein